MHDIRYAFSKGSKLGILSLLVMVETVFDLALNYYDHPAQSCLFEDLSSFCAIHCSLEVHRLPLEGKCL